MLRKCEQGVRAGEVPCQARHAQAPAPAPTSQVYIRAGKLESWSWKLELGYIRTRSELETERR